MSQVTTTVLGYPRIGAGRELKRVTEDYWAGRVDAIALGETAAGLRRGVWRELSDAGLDAVPSDTFSLYDHVLDAVVLTGGILRAVRRGRQARTSRWLVAPRGWRRWR